MARLRFDAVRGELTYGIGTSDTTISSPGLARLGTVTGGDVALICLYVADLNNNITASENVYITNHLIGATTATVTRGGDGTSPLAWQATSAWNHGLVLRM